MIKRTIICDCCQLKSNKIDKFMKVYFYPQNMPITTPYQLDICETCITYLLGDEELKEMKQHFNNAKYREEE